MVCACKRQPILEIALRKVYIPSDVPRLHCVFARAKLRPISHLLFIYLHTHSCGLPQGTVCSFFSLFVCCFSR